MKILITLLMIGLMTVGVSALAFRSNQRIQLEDQPEKITSWDVTFTVRDPNTEDPIEGVFITIVQEAPSLIGQHTSNTFGQFNQRLNIGETYTFVLTKEGYGDRTLHKTINSPFPINLWM